MRIRVGTRKGLFTIEKVSEQWKVTDVAFIGDPITMVLTDPRDGASYAAVRLGHFGVKLHRQNKDSSAWEEITPPAYPPKPEGVIDKEPNSGKEIPWVADTIWALEPGGTDQPGELWCGTIPGGLFRSADSGKSWSLVRSLWDHPGRKEWFGGGADMPGIHSICVDPRDPRRVFVGVSCGGVWRTEDRGETWSVKADGMIARFMPPERQMDPLIQDPHRVVMCKDAPDQLWAQHHCGIFVSDNGGEKWREVTALKPSTFGFAVAVHPHDPKTAWFVPAISDERRTTVNGEVVVSRTRDGGESGDVLRDGLPQQHAYDLVFRHSLDIDDRGEMLAFGSTTGAVWVTENGGDRWTEVTAHLPPIYVLRID